MRLSALFISHKGERGHREVVCPRDQWLADVNAGKDFLTTLIEWEIKVAAYEVASGDRISDAVRVATIMDHAPDVLKSMLRSSPLEQRRSVDALKLWIRQSSNATPGLFQGSMPMQVGAVSDGGKGKKGKSKSTGDKGKGKGKGKDKNKHEGNDGDKNKERDDWNIGQRQAKFQRYFSHCSKWSHKRADCRTRLAQQAFKNLILKLGISKQHNGVTSTVKTWTWTRRVGVLQRRTTQGARQALCADDHICQPDFAKEFPFKKSAGLTCKATHHLSTAPDTFGETLRNGFVFNLRGENDSIMYHHRDPTTTAPSFLHKNSLRIRANPIVHHVSPVMEDDVPVRLSGQSPLRLLDRRLDELALPKHGTKLDKWTLIEKRENELMRERKSQAAIESEREAGPEGRCREAAIPISDHVNRRSQRRKFTSSLICHHSHGANIVSEEEVRKILTSG